MTDKRVSSQATTANPGFLLAKASQRWNQLLAGGFAAAGYPQVRPAFGSVLLPLFEQDRLQMGELARRARLSKQTMTTIVRAVEEAGFVSRRPDPQDGRASLVCLTARARRFRPVAERVLRDLAATVREALGEVEAESLERSLAAIADLHGAGGDADGGTASPKE